MADSHPLLQLSDAELGPYYEDRVISALSLERTTLDELAGAYRALSAVLNDGPSGPSASVSLAGVEERVRLGAWLLIYGFRTVMVARRLLRAFPLEGAGLTELGSGAGPFGLVAAASGSEVELVDLDGPTLAASGPFYDAFELPSPTTRRLDVTHALGRDAVVAAPYSAMEWPKETQAKLRKRLKSGRAFVVERGTQPGGQFIQSLRDDCAANVSAPCPPREACAFADRPRDWCHFTWRLAPGPLTRRVADIAGRKWKELHVSFAVFGFGALDGDRVLSVRRQGKQKSVADLCTRDGVERLVALKRSAAFDVVEALEPGSLVSVDRDRAPKKGDGLRVDARDTLSVIRPL